MGALHFGRLALQALIIAALGACAGGGGGGGGGAVVAPPPPPPPVPAGAPRPPPVTLPALPAAAAPGSFPNTASAEFNANWGPNGINADAAWQYQNAHGEGILIGVIDDGIHPGHPELAGRVDTVNSIDIVPGRNDLTTTLSHGSELSSLIAGNFNGSQTVGVAYRATILAVRADDGASSFQEDALADALNYAVSKGVRVVNFSLGSTGPTTANLQNAIQAATNAGVILVFSAGNSGAGAGQPNYPGFLAVTPSVSNGLIMIAGGSNPDGSFNTISNPAGTARNSYLVAPGWQIVVPDYGPAGPVPGFQVCYPNPSNCTGLVQIQGTSYASPHVTAAAAVLMSAFPGLTSAQVVQILLQSTDDMGASGIDTQTGWGHLNLARAFQPIGTVSAPLGGVEFTPSDTVLGQAGAAFGDGFTANAAPWRVASFDNFGRTYNIDLSPNWARAQAGPSANVNAPALWRAERAASGARVEMALAEDVAPESYRLPVDRAELEQTAMRIDADLAAGLTLSFAANGARALGDQASASVGHLDFVNSDTSLRLTRQLVEGLSVSLISESGSVYAGADSMPVGRSAAAARASLALGRAGFDITVGQLEEQSGVLGLTWARGLGHTPGGRTDFAGFSGYVDPGAGWRLRFDAELGVAELTQTGWLEMVEPLRTSAFALEVTHAMTPAWFSPFGVNGSGQMSFTLSQPLRVESGALAFMAPTATRWGRQSLSYERRVFEPLPSGRETRFGLGYRYFAGDVFSAFGEVIYVQEPGHAADAAPEGVARLGLRVRR